MVNEKNLFEITYKERREPRVLQYFNLHKNYFD